jgi:carboxylesterase
MSEPAVIAGAEAQSWPGGPHGVLVCHGFTGNPSSMRGLAAAFAAAGFAVELPRWPGHGTTVEDMITTGWDDWSSAAEAAYQELAARCDKVVVAGLSMGGTLTCWLAANHPEIAGIVCINPAVEPPAESFLELMQGMLDSGAEVIPGIGSDIAKEGVAESAYEGTPIRPLTSMFAAVTDLAERLGDVRCPVLLFNSPQDHVVPPSASDFLAERVAGPIERVTCERSYHVATLDFDKDDIESRSVEFAKKVTAS